MKTVQVENCQLTLAEAADTNEPIILTRSGQAVAALFPINQDDIESLSLSQNPAFLSILERSVRRGEEEGWIPLAEVRRRMGLTDGSP